MVYHFTRLSGRLLVLLVLVYWYVNLYITISTSCTKSLVKLCSFKTNRYFALQVTGDKQGAVFGGLLDCPLKPTAKRKYQVCCILLSTMEIPFPKTVLLSLSGQNDLKSCQYAMTHFARLF